MLVQPVGGRILNNGDMVAGVLVADAEQNHVTTHQVSASRQPDEAFGGKVVLKMRETAR